MLYSQYRVIRISRIPRVRTIAFTLSRDVKNRVEREDFTFSSSERTVWKESLTSQQGHSFRVIGDSCKEY